MDQKVADQEAVGQPLVNGTEFLYLKMFSYENESESPRLVSWNVTDVKARMITV